jgi:nicotinate phosphoribosyltransferase
VSTALLTDHYELTMVNAALASGIADRAAVFEVFARHLPQGRRYGVVAGTQRLMDAILEFRFDSAEIDFLTSHGIVNEDTATWLCDYRFSGTIRGYQEGELYFPGSPLLVVEGTFAESVIIETLVLSVLNYDSAVASAAARMVQAAHNRPLIEMGARRANERSAVAAARAAYIAGFDATSNLEAGRSFGIPTRGTAAHSFTLVHDSEEDAFRAQIQAMGENTTLLVDTYNIEEGVAQAIRLAGTRLGGVRIDSGDLPVVVSEVRAHLDSLGAHSTKIVVTNDLNEHTIAGLRGAPVDIFGVGTSVVTGSGSPAVGLVYKLVARTDKTGEWVAVAKTSSHKTNPGGRKTAYRVREGQFATEELVHIGPGSKAPAKARPLMVTLMSNGVPTDTSSPALRTQTARAHHQAVIKELSPAAFSLQPGDPILPTRFRHEGV